MRKRKRKNSHHGEQLNMKYRQSILSIAQRHGINKAFGKYNKVRLYICFFDSAIMTEPWNLLLVIPDILTAKNQWCSSVD